MVAERKIRPKVTHRCCPDCGYMETQFVIDLMKVDMPCVECGKCMISEFQPLRLEVVRNNKMESL